MTMILYRYNLKRYTCPTYPPNKLVRIQHFPKNVQEAARYAKRVEFRDGDFVKILKDRFSLVGTNRWKFTVTGTEENLLKVLSSINVPVEVNIEYCN